MMLFLLWYLHHNNKHIRIRLILSYLIINYLINILFNFYILISLYFQWFLVILNFNCFLYLRIRSLFSIIINKLHSFFLQSQHTFKNLFLLYIMFLKIQEFLNKLIFFNSKHQNQFFTLFKVILFQLF